MAWSTSAASSFTLQSIMCSVSTRTYQLQSKLAGWLQHWHCSHLHACAFAKRLHGGSKQQSILIALHLLHCRTSLLKIVKCCLEASLHSTSSVLGVCLLWLWLCCQSCALLWFLFLCACSPEQATASIIIVSFVRCRNVSTAHPNNACHSPSHTSQHNDVSDSAPCLLQLSYPHSCSWVLTWVHERSQLASADTNQACCKDI